MALNLLAALPQVEKMADAIAAEASAKPVAPAEVIKRAKRSKRVKYSTFVPMQAEPVEQTVTETIADQSHD